MAIDLVCHLLDYTPATRLTPLEACAHAFFDELRDPETRLPNGSLPLLFNFSQYGSFVFFFSFIHSINFFLNFYQELSFNPSLNARLLPAHMQGQPIATSNSTATSVGPIASNQEKSMMPATSSSPTASMVPDEQATTSNVHVNMMDNEKMISLDDRTSATSADGIHKENA